MTWTETTVVNPEVWGRRVGQDLLDGLYRGQLHSLHGYPKLSRESGLASDADLAAAASFESEFWAAHAGAAAQITTAQGPQTVTLTPGGATVTPFLVPTAEEHAAHEAYCEGLRASRADGLRFVERVAIAQEADVPPPLIQGGATAPSYAATPNVGSGLIPGTLDTSLTAPTNVTTIVTGGTNGTKLEQLDFQGVGTTVAGVLNVFLYDGSTYHLINGGQILLTAVTSSTTAVAYAAIRQFQNLIVKNGWTLKVAQTVSGNVSLVKVTGYGGDL